MEAGEKELRKAFEDVTRGNVQAAVDFTNSTRKLLLEVQQDLQNTNNNLEMLRTEIAQVRSLAAQALQIQVSGGSTDLN